MNRRYNQALARSNDGVPPIWLMRQAGRYHAHYQALRKRHSFIELCKESELACEVTMGPIRDFDFDAAIMFSDLLFPLEAMGMGLRYEPGPKLDFHLTSEAALDRIHGGRARIAALEFQAQALKRIRTALDPSKALLGFVGGPFTLFAYAVEGSHQGDLSPTLAGLKDKRWPIFLERLVPLLIENMVLQADAGPDTVAVFDTCAGELDPETYGTTVVPVLRAVFEAFKARKKDVGILYYSRGTNPLHWRKLKDLPFDQLGVDWRHDLSAVLKEFGSQWSIQGNFDPEMLTKPEPEFQSALEGYLTRIRAQTTASERRGWVAALGHGVMPSALEANVRHFVKRHRDLFGASQ